ncbi:hypothetical protein OG320_16520 [Microbispora sp. NBC_01189]|uniref:hypothetical protein n=1 Tax=Microbispora sp. NBC_01189 TaxID=2903583 RepID=UPI002E13C87C|nr:hypothetical protein OG320_16520 [Microbispora sp. NBC_01189]
MAYVEREHLGDLQALGHRDDRGVNGAEGQVRIAFDQRGETLARSGLVNSTSVNTSDSRAWRNAASDAAPPNLEII